MFQYHQYIDCQSWLSKLSMPLTSLEALNLVGSCGMGRLRFTEGFNLPWSCVEIAIKHVVKKEIREEIINITND